MSRIVEWAEREANRDPRALDFSYTDGGRREAGYRGAAGDCVARAIVLATANGPIDWVLPVEEDMGACKI